MTPPRLRRPSDIGEAPLRDIDLLAWRAPLYLVQDSPSLAYRRYPNARYRFDALAGQYAVVYANDSRLGVFGETYVK